MNKIGMMFSDLGQMFKQNLPKIKLGAGLASGAATIFLACRATLKVEAIMDDFHYEIDEISKRTDVTEGAELNRLIFAAYKDAFLRLARLYSPAFCTGVASAALIISAFNDVSKKLNAATAATASLLAAYNGLKEKFIEKYGEDEFNKLLNDEYETVVEMKENGTVTTDKKLKKANMTLKSPFTILLEQGKSPIWPQGMTPETLISELKNINNVLRNEACYRYSTGKMYKSVSAERIVELLKIEPSTKEEAFMYSSYGKTYNPADPDSDFIVWGFDTQSYEEFLGGIGLLWIHINVDPEPRF